VVAVGAVSLGDGSYLLGGLAPGTYGVLAEPLDGPVGEENLGGIFDASVRIDFRTTYYGGSTAPAGIAVGAGAASRVDLDVGTSAPTLNLTLLGTASTTTPGAFLLSAPPLSVPRGGTFDLAVGSSATTFASVVASMDVSGSGISFDFARRRLFISNRGFVVTLTIAADAPLGARNVSVTAGAEVSVLAGGLIVADQRKLVFPRIESSASSFTGIALSNPSQTADAVLTFDLRDDGGARLATGDAANPAARFLFAEQQLAQLGSEIFNLPTTLVEGWAEVSVWDDPDAVGFFVSFNDRLTLFDGVDVSTRKGRQLWFNVIDKSGFTELDVVNPGASAVTATLSAYSESGASSGSASFTIAARGRLVAANRGRKLADFFPGVSFSAGGHVEIDASGEVTGCEVFGTSAHIAMLAGALPGDAATTLYSAQLANGVGNFFTRVEVSNPNSASASLSLTANLVDAGTGQVTSRRTATRSVAARGKLSEDAASLFGLGTSEALGWIQVSSTSPVIGSVTFGDTGGKFEASVPMQAAGRTRAIFSQVAHGAGSPFYTGIALLNPDNARAAQVAIDVFREDGTKSGSASLRLGPGDRLAKLLDQFVAELSAGQVRGYIRITSDLPILTFELFGDTGGESLVGVPPQ